jgi:hypothetical protein
MASQIHHWFPFGVILHNNRTCIYPGDWESGHISHVLHKSSKLRRTLAPSKEKKWKERNIWQTQKSRDRIFFAIFLNEKFAFLCLSIPQACLTFEEDSWRSILDDIPFRRIWTIKWQNRAFILAIVSSNSPMKTLSFFFSWI